MSKNLFRVEYHNPNYLDPQYLFPTNSPIKSLRLWQPQAYEALKDARFAAVQAFCGSGKSILLNFLSAHDIVSSGYTQKQLTIVPQEHISRGFTKNSNDNFIRMLLEGKEYVWHIQPEHNFCEGYDRIAKLKTWLLTSSSELSKGFRENTLGGLNAICSHAALAIAWKSLSSKEKFKATRNLTLIGDEAQHINHIYLNTEDITSEEWLAIDEDSTELGRICRFIINNDDKTCKLRLASATMYRGDRRTILSRDVRGLFVEYNLDWLDHFHSLGIKSFNLQYEEYDFDPINQIVSKIKEEPKEKHFVVVPSTGSKWRISGNEHEKLLQELGKTNLRILDLVTQATQDKNKEKLLLEPKSPEDGESQYDVVVVCMLGREGTDWCPCSRLHNSSCESSITLAVQTTGRPFRRFAGKEEVKIYHYVRKFKMPKKGLTKRELVSDRTNALLFCMQLRDMINPIVIPSFPSQDQQNKESHSSKQTLSTIFGDQYEDVKEAIIEGYESLEEKTKEEVYALAERICDEYEIQENREGIVDGLVAFILREANQELQLQGIDVSFLRTNGFDKIVEKYHLNKTILFGDYSQKDWKILREITQAQWDKNFEELKRIGIDEVKKMKGTPIYQFALQLRKDIESYEKQKGIK